MMGFRDRGLVRLEDDLGPVVVHVQGPQDQDQPTHRSVNIFLV